MNNNKQSSVEWFAEQTLNAFITKEKYDELLAQAKEMHKEEIETAWDRGEYIGISFAHRNIDEIYEQNAEDYYNKTFGGNNG